jgi:tRNA A37 threonylcarbamoyladenosine synthetase subunit TsaC/SUA5/YrdC
LESKVDLIIEGGTVGIEPTTVIDLTDTVPVLVRRGKGAVSHFGIADSDEN